MGKKELIALLLVVLLLIVLYLTGDLQGMISFVRMML
jgi:hypothetical protein